LILDRFNQKWDKRLDEYELVTEISDDYELVQPAEKGFKEAGDEKKLRTLEGSWQIFSYDKEKTELRRKQEESKKKEALEGKEDSEKKVNWESTEFLSVSNLTISTEQTVICLMNGTRFIGDIHLINPGTIKIDLQANYRHLTMYGTIGLKDDLSGVDRITVTYSESGDGLAACGLAFLHKMAEDELLQKEERVSFDTIERLSTVEKECLVGTQHFAPEWKFSL
jgi:hypothetical protein